MKQLYILFLLASTLAAAQIPANYYDSANGLSGYALKTQLKTITTTGHTAQSYGALYTGYVTTHTDTSYENDGTVLDFYSENPTGADPYNYNHGVAQCGNQTQEGDCYNREHLVPQSSFGSALPMQTDIHHVVPSDGRVNGFRSNFPFGEVATPNFTSLNGSLRGSSAIAGYSGTVFEPIDEFKGDIARALLYFATRYEDTVDGYIAFDMFNGTNDQAFQTWAVTMLLDWHYNVDPVSQDEIDRNNAAYNYQGNANPFVDHPEYANLIWNPTPDTTPPTNPTNLIASNPTDTTIDLSWTASTDNIGVASYDVYVGGVNSYNTASTSFTVPGLTANTNYCFTIKAKDAAGNESGFSNQICEMTTNNGSSGSSNELFFSEYMEGSGNNKALEIANFTGATVDLSTYEIRLSPNGNAAWTAIYNFPIGAMITHGDVYVVANTGLAVCTTVVDNSSNTPTAFNGNDALGLFNGSMLIDALGTLGNGTTYAQNTTLVRKPEILSPNVTYTATEWNSFASNTCDDLGSHTVSTLSVNTNTLETVELYPNPVKGSTLTVSTKSNMDIIVFDILGKQVLTKTITATNNQIDVSQLKKGVYLIRLLSDSGSITKKFIRQ